jgi:hypothetical protein
MNRNLLSLATVFSFICLFFTSCMESNHCGLPTTRIGGKECVVINFPDQITLIALPVEIYDAYYKALSKEVELFADRINPIGDESASVMSYMDEVAAVDITSFYKAISQMEDEYNLLYLNKFVDQMHGTIGTICDLCIDISRNVPDYDSYLYSRCMEKRIANAFNMAHIAFPDINFDLQRIIIPGIEDMRYYANPNNYNFEEVGSRASEWALQKMTIFSTYDYLCSDEQLDEIVSMEQSFKIKAGFETNTDGNGE